MSVTTLFLFALLREVVAAPQVTVSPYPPVSTPVLPSICGVLSNVPACPTGYKCQPYVTRYCAELEPDELCGYCTTVSPPSPPRSTTCPSGYTADYRNFCRPVTTTKTSSTSTFTCPAGYTPDYRGASYCRLLPTCASGMSQDYRGLCHSTTRSTTSTCAAGMTTDYRGLCRSPSPTPTPTTQTCSPGFVADYRGFCRTATSSSSTNPCASGSITDYRGYCRATSSPSPTPTARYSVGQRDVPVTTKPKPKTMTCDVRRGPKCADESGKRFICSSTAYCPPFIAFCPGTCVGVGTVKTPTFIVDPPPPTFIVDPPPPTGGVRV
ncbi:hypothetical protein P154DRAFT_576982 [Amniculicola lignicola CBS 123094]|uniref:Uncharacterized protein n=1 Tax=Amniculicola lignicola CBS 123094 TaxID=1392246 RepID=A0A6A5WHE0_9PLEO|nr:hypothetical protein P154DRAFT_576982 [Amniculicola lignicola CBS 123094]